MLVDRGDGGLGIDRQYGTRLEFLVPESFSGLSGGAWQARKYSVRRDSSYWTQVGMIMSEHRIRSERQHRPVSSLIKQTSQRVSRRAAPEVCKYFLHLSKREAAGNAGCALHPRSPVQNGAKKHTRAYRFSGGKQTFPAPGLYGLCLPVP